MEETQNQLIMLQSASGVIRLLLGCELRPADLAIFAKTVTQAFLSTDVEDEVGLSDTLMSLQEFAEKCDDLCLEIFSNETIDKLC